MHDLPSPAQLLAAVARFLRDEAGPALATAGEAALAYQARVAANMLDTVARQAELAPAAEAAERTRLLSLLNMLADTERPAAETDLTGLNRRLVEAIASGALALGQPGLTDHLWQTTLDKLAVDQPAYDTYRRWRDRPPADGG